MLIAPASTARPGPASKSASVVLCRLRALSALTPEVAELIGDLHDVQRFKAGAELAGERTAAARTGYVIGGWAARVRWLRDGRRQIVQLVLPGEGVGVCLRHNPLGLSSTVALTNVELLDAGPVQDAVAGDDPYWQDMRDLIHLSASLEEAHLLNQIVRLGRQTAYERMCHLLLEMDDRLAMAGLCENDMFPMPLTQEMLADTTGLSIVHVNRTLQQLRREHLLDLRSGRARLLDRAAMAIIADYRRPTSPMA